MKHHDSHTWQPAKQGLYDPQNEKDACGIGLIAHIGGEASNQIVRDGMGILHNLDHRGAVGADPDTGDGAGILLQIPHRFLKEEVDFDLPNAGDYGVGMIFMPRDEDAAHACREQLEAIVREEGQTVLGWRDVPTDDATLGEMAVASQPAVKMVFVGREKWAGADFERVLFKIRRKTVNAVQRVENIYSNRFYICSFSGRTLLYKGMLTTAQLSEYYPDLKDKRVESAFAMIHSRFSTNTFPNWARAHPYRFLMHNGEINTLRGNVNWMRAREKMMSTPHFKHISALLPIVDEDGSDSGMLDNAVEFLVMNGLPLAHVMMMLVPEPWQKNPHMDAQKRAFYEYHACVMEPWDGPAALCFTDGVQIGAALDRNGLRPGRYVITKDNRLILSSETGVLQIEPANIVRKGRLEPGKMLLLDLEQGRIIPDEEIKQSVSTTYPYQEWLDQNLIELENLAEKAVTPDLTRGSAADLIQNQMAFGYTFEDLRILLAPMAEKGSEAIGSMGDDTPLAVLSQKPRLLYDYFKQLFAQVTNPPIDAIREELVTATEVFLGADGNMLLPSAETANRIKLKHPILTDKQLFALQTIKEDGFHSATLPVLYNPNEGGKGLENALNYLCEKADEAIEAGANLIILTDRGVNKQNAAVPALLATSAVHHHLIKNGSRVKVSLVVDSAEPRQVHHMACLLGYGAEAINPYLAYATLKTILDKKLVDIDYDVAVYHYVKALVKGIVKVCSKMGISTIQSYGGAQIFEALGLQSDVVERYFTGTSSRIQGSDLETIAQEVSKRHTAAFPTRPSNGIALPVGGMYQDREDGESHAYDPDTVHALQRAVRSGDYDAFKTYSSAVNAKEKRTSTLRGLLKLKRQPQPIPLDEVEPIEAICSRFKTGAMSYGSISTEAHRTLAIAMNRIGGKSNTGEGGEERDRLTPLPNGDSARSAIKQVASGRFGVTSEYLSNAVEIQIKMAQGAKPGEGGQLPGHKVYPWIAKVRFSTPGVGLISPPPHHDIYSIEDLAQLIYDLKNANPQARINVKLVSEVGVGTIAAGVAKARADVILISGYGGGTGAAPMTSIKHAGLPWELGIAEAHQTLLLNDLRGRVRLETDGQLKTGRDVVVAALLGAEEFGFSTAPLISIGCIMMRVCHLNTCPVGVATQNPELRKKFTGKPEHVVNFMHFIAQEMREIMAELGVRTINELVGNVDLLDTEAMETHWKADGIDLSNVLHIPDVEDSVSRYQTETQYHPIGETLDSRVLLNLCADAIENQTPTTANLPIRNINRTVGTLLGHQISKKYGLDGLPEDTINIAFKGSAGQSFGAFVPKGVTFSLEGDSNDYFGKGLSGGKLSVFAPETAGFEPAKNVIIGNTALYGATSGSAFIGGLAGERFAVRNSGAVAVVEGTGDHGCEYMTGGRVVVLGKVGRNFAAGMSGGIAVIYDADGSFEQKVNTGLVDVEPLVSTKEEAVTKALIEQHVDATNSAHGQAILSNWDEAVTKMFTVIPRDYQRVLNAIEEAKAKGLDDDSAELLAFEKTK